MQPTGATFQATPTLPLSQPQNAPHRAMLGPLCGPLDERRQGQGDQHIMRLDEAFNKEPIVLYYLNRESCKRLGRDTFSSVSCTHCVTPCHVAIQL